MPPLILAVPIDSSTYPHLTVSINAQRHQKGCRTNMDDPQQTHSAIIGLKSFTEACRLLSSRNVLFTSQCVGCNIPTLGARRQQRIQGLDRVLLNTCPRHLGTAANYRRRVCSVCSRLLRYYPTTSMCTAKSLSAHQPRPNLLFRAVYDSKTSFQ